MDEPKLDMINLNGLVNRLNSIIDDSEGEVSIGNFIDKLPRKKGRVEIRGKYPLIQTVVGFMDLESEINLGYILVEAGGTNSSVDYGGIYESIKLRIKHPLKLKNGELIPNCKINIQIKSEEFETPYKKRDDHVYPLFWRKNDISNVLPTKWFLDKSKTNYKERLEDYIL